MGNDIRDMEELLPGYFSDNLSDSDRAIIDEWRKESVENENIYKESLNAWKAMPLLHEMERFNSFDALKKVNYRISDQKKSNRFIFFVQRIAASLMIPLLIYSGYITMRNYSLKEQITENVIMQTISSRQGMVTQFNLADGTKVWLNSGSSLQFPSRFIGDFRKVKLIGEAFFEVTKNEKQPFQVNAKNLKIEVLGTSFNVVNYEDEQQTDVVLVEGKVKLFTEVQQIKKDYGIMHPGQRVVYSDNEEKIMAENVVVDKYIAWRDGNLIFRNDKMEDVAKRLSHWFNVEIIINDPIIKNYIYKATFRDENLMQVLNLLKISAPIDYEIVGNKLLPDGVYTKQKIYLMKKKI